jgi:hypothetical protein
MLGSLALGGTGRKNRFGFAQGLVFRPSPAHKHLRQDGRDPSLLPNESWMRSRISALNRCGHGIPPGGFNLIMIPPDNCHQDATSEGISL